MKVLFITEYMNAPGQGAYMVANAHYNTFCETFGKKNIDAVSIKTRDSSIIMDNFINLSGYNTKFDRLKNLLSGYPPFMSKKVNQQILEIINENKYDLIYFDNCYFGTTIKSIKKCNFNLKIWTFYHGVKANSSRQLIKKNLLKPQFLIAAINNIRQERLATKYSDVCILLNERENRELYKYYKRNADFLLPVYYDDTAKISISNDDSDEFRILFLGGYFWPNVIGITWFAKNVMPYLNKNAKLYIVGRDMNKLNDVCFNVKNIEVVGETDDLNYWYNSSHIVVGPIFNGDGMKTKTAEALMYGKKYIGTDEALCGYVGLDNFRCNTAEEFIEIINDLMNQKINKYDGNMRELYEKHYSPKSAKIIIESILEAEK